MKSQRYGRSHPRSGFTPDEDCLLIDLVAQFGNDSWTTIASFMEKRNARQCKDRYTSYLSPTINNGPYSEEEDELLRKKYHEIGPKWVKISKFFPNRTDISVKCRWAVLNRRDLKMKEKKLNTIQAKSQKNKNIKKINSDNISDSNNSEYSSSSPLDQDSLISTKESHINDYSLAFSKPKSRSGANLRKSNSIDSRSHGLTMSIRKRNKKRIDYDDDDNYKDSIQIQENDFDDIEQSNDMNSSSLDSNSSSSVISAPSSLSTTDNESSANSPTPNVTDSYSFGSNNKQENSSPQTVDSFSTFSVNNYVQNQSSILPNVNSASLNSSNSLFSLNSMKLNDTFSGYNKLNEDFFIDNHASFFPTQGNYSNQMMNMGMVKNENLNNYYNNYVNKYSTDNYMRANNNANNGNYINNLQQNNKNNQYTYDRNNSLFFPSTITNTNVTNCMNSFNNDNKQSMRTFDETLADDLSWDICWDIPVSEMKDSSASMNLFCNSQPSFE
ncbi:hypothetical protein M9Y10_042172 [Tritrichomonas musculus]|uniref:Myb-like DNA-binding domain containing protein n=1 Tax=Tritrichomonas musculus TaxID=1915356 RepID=A0ABR2K6I9_9EUKA